MHFRTAWDDYFTGTPTLFKYNVYEVRQVPTVTSVHVSNCLFKSITSLDAHGGALYCNSSVTYLLVESTSFFTCKTDKNGGAIYFTNQNNGQCVLHEVCGYDCCTTSYCDMQFAYNTVCNGVSYKNYINYSSILRCVNEKSWNVLNICNGKICFPSVNLSMNKCNTRSFLCNPVSDSNSVTCSFSYSTFVDSNETSHTCICFWRTGAKYEIKNCNILRNTQGALNSDGTIYTNGYLTIDDSCILENTATYIFRSSSSYYTITLSNCTVDSTSNNGYLTTQNTVTKGFILALNHMSTQNCHSEYDSAGYLTPIIQTPSSSNKQIHCYTGKKFLHQIPLSDVVSVFSILILNFIHP
jgi:hypothetical protein